MLRTTRTFGSFAVNDLDAARRFYTDTLGMKVTTEGEQAALWLHSPDGHVTLVYPKADHTPAVFTVFNLSVDDINEAVDELGARGVTFERYEGMDADERGIVRAEGVAAAWFTDPSGNVVAVLQE